MSDGQVIAPAQHKQLTKEEKQELIDTAFGLERQIKHRVGAAHEAWWDLAESLYEFHELRGWTLLGYETLSEFLAQPDVGMSERSFYNAVRLWRDLAVTRQLPAPVLKEVEPTKAREVVPAIMAGQVKAEVALDDAKELSYRDVVEKYHPERQKATGQSPNDSKLDASKEPERMKCPMCQSWVRKDQIVIEEEGEEVDAKG